MKIRTFFILAFVCTLQILGMAQQKIQFPSSDGITITADLYSIGAGKPFIVLCHLAGHSRGEYKDTAKKLNQAGFNCLALDARSGNEVFGIKNETAIEARKQNKPTEYLDAEKDIIAAIDYTYELAKKNPVILLGSSYSASLALKIGAVNPKVLKVLSFSPGEYFGEELNLKKSITGLKKPLFVTSSKEEAGDVGKLISDLPKEIVTHFIPKGNGAHGSIALWKDVPEHQEYWDAMLAFLKK
jgi:dienelactone hydrolase